jgi:hypothetical protein
MPDVSHGRKVFRCSQARVLIARGIHSLEEISIGISYRGDLLSGLAIALSIRLLNPSLFTPLFDSDVARTFSFQIPSLRTTLIVDRVTTTAGASTYE